jgi:hypothetical protein
MAWVTVDQANTYFADSLESVSWDGVTNKSGAINSAFRVLSTHPAYVFPETATENMQNANAEYARYLATTSSARQNLIEQGVKSFSIGDFSETLKDTDEGYGTNIKLPSIVKQYLEEYEIGPGFVGFFDRPQTRIDI